MRPLELAFGSRTALDFVDPTAMSDLISRSGSSQVDYRSLNAEEPFRSSLARADIGGLSLIANAGSAVHCSGAGLGRAHLLIPSAGQGVTHCDGRPVEWNAKQAALLSAVACRSESSERSLVSVDIDGPAIQSVARTMLGADGVGRPLDLSTPRALQLDIADIQFGRVFGHYMAMLNAMDGDRIRIERSGLDDLILRVIVMLLRPADFFGDPVAPLRSDARIGALCDHICAHLDRKITLTELERLSGLSARSLQYRFRSAFGVSPMQWIAEQRLTRVRQQILSARPGVNLAAIAGAYFGNLGDFARFYRERFGEPPSATLRRAQGRRLRN